MASHVKSSLHAPSLLRSQVMNRREDFAMNLSSLSNEEVKLCNCPRKAGKSTIVHNSHHPNLPLTRDHRQKVISIARPISAGSGSRASKSVFAGEIPDVITPYLIDIRSSHDLYSTRAFRSLYLLCEPCSEKNILDTRFVHAVTERRIQARQNRHHNQSGSEAEVDQWVLTC